MPTNFQILNVLNFNEKLKFHLSIEESNNQKIVMTPYKLFKIISKRVDNPMRIRGDESRLWRD